MKNNRKFHRIDFDKRVSLMFSNNNYTPYQCKNLSLTGMFVTGDFQQLTDDKCQIYLSLAEQFNTITFQASAKVVWSNDEGVGLKFTSMPLDSYKSLLTKLIDHTEMPEVVLYELSRICPFELSKK